MKHYVPEKQLDELRKVSEETGLSVSECVRRAISLYLTKKTAESLVKEEVARYMSNINATPE